MRNKIKILDLLLISATAFFMYSYTTLSKNNSKKMTMNMVGVYWGAFDPPTPAHSAIICTALTHLPLKKLFVVVNNHEYKKYTHSLEARLYMLEQMLPFDIQEKIELLWQDDINRIDYQALKTLTQDNLCVIAGYDAYHTWCNHSQPEERALYDAIAIVPRGDEQPLLYDKNAFLLPIDGAYKYVSSTKARTACSCKSAVNTSRESPERNTSIK